MTENRTTYRRYEDRRVAMMLTLHEILFNEPPSAKRDALMLEAIVRNYHVDRAALLDVNVTERRASIVVRVGDWQSQAPTLMVSGGGFDQLLRLHDSVDGALTFESVRKPEVFGATVWDDLWKNGVVAPTRALLSVAVKSSKGEKLLWLQQAQSSREWGSRDRDLAEEIAYLLTKALAKGV